VAARAATRGVPPGGPRADALVPAGPRRATRVERLRAARQFQAVFQQGKRIEQPSFVCLWLPGEGWTLGVAVSRQVRGAVPRNRIRRRLREACRRVTLEGDGARVVLVGRPRALACPFGELVEEAARALAAVRRGAGEMQRRR
jgi:ribonuclease P protein component